MGTTGQRGHRAWMLLGLALAPALLQSQPVYRCGNSYGQTPCVNGVVISVDDARSASQKAQTDAATAQAARLADRMERERLAAERRASAAPARPPPGTPKSPEASTRTKGTAASNTTAKSSTRPKPGSNEADHFTASVWSAGTKKKTAAAPQRD